MVHLRRRAHLQRLVRSDLVVLLAEMVYPDRFEVRYVSANGGIRWRKQWVNVSSALVGQHVGLEVVDDGLLDVYFGVMKLGRLHERHMRIEDHMGRFRRCP